MYQVAVRTADRVVVQWGEIRADPQAPERADGVGLGAPDGCVVETVSARTLAAILAAMPDHGGGVILSADHHAVTPAPEPPGYREHLAGQDALRAMRDEIAAHAAANPDDLVAKLARVLGVA